MPKKKNKNRIGVVDAETDPFEPGQHVAPFIWGLLLDTGEYFEFLTTALLVAWIRAQPEGLILYAHNGGKFDYHFLREDIEGDSPISVVAGRLARCHIGTTELRDSLNLFGQTRLADFSKEKIDYRLMRKGVREAHMPEIRKYLKADCVSLLTLVTSFIEKFGLQFTQAGAAMKYWQKHHAPRGVNERGIEAGILPHSTAVQYQRYSPFYYGGRVQCFASGHAYENFSVVDINSAYPRAMCDAHPYDTNALEMTHLPKREESIAQCLVEIDAVSKGALPIRASDGSLFFPEDENKVRRYHVTGWELLAGLDTGTVKLHKVHACHYFGEPVSFRGYVDHFYCERANAKLANDKAMDIFAKIFMNGLYGKFAANPTKYEEFVLSTAETDAYEHWKKLDYTDHGAWGGRRMLVRPVPVEKHRYYNIATAASITGWVRAFLWRALLKSDSPLYCDTDSIAAKGVSRLDTGPKLGQWKLEAECDEYAIAGKKNYAFHIAGKSRPLHVSKQKPLDAREDDAEWKALRECWKVASKGSDLTPQQLIDASEGRTVKYRASVANFSVHRNDFIFIDRDVRNTYRDISDLDAYEAA